MLVAPATTMEAATTAGVEAPSSTVEPTTAMRSAATTTAAACECRIRC